MKILVAVVDSQVGGVTTAAINFCNELQQRGNDVFFLDMSERYLCANALHKEIQIGKLAGKSKYWNLKVNNLKKEKGLRKCKLAFLGLVKKLTIRSGLWYRLIFKSYKEFGEYDIAIAFKQCAPCYSFILNKVKAKKKVGFVHGALKPMGDISSWRKYMTQLDKVAYVSNAVQEEFVLAYPELSANACTIYNMLDSRFIIQQASAKCDSVFDKEKVNIVTVSRIENDHKRVDRIAWICKKLKDNGILDFAWYVVGGGPDYEKCVQQVTELGVGEVLHFIGPKENPYPYIFQTDFTVLPSKTEAFGLVVVESLILNKPVIACEYPALKELLDDGVTGLIAKQEDDALYSAVYTLLTDYEMRAKLISHCLKYEYSNDKAYQQFLEAIE